MGIGSVLKVTYGGASPSTAGPFLLNETFTKGKMKDKSSKKGGNEQNEINADLLRSHSVSHITPVWWECVPVESK